MAQTSRSQTNQQRERQATAALIALYVLAEQQLTAAIAGMLAAPAKDYFAQLAQVAKIRQLAATVVTHLGQQTPPLIQEVISAAAQGGVDEAVRALAEIPGEGPVVHASTINGVTRRPHEPVMTTSYEHPVVRVPVESESSGGVPPRPPEEPPVSTPGSDGFDFSLSQGQRAAQAIADDLTSELDDVRYRITRLDDDIYKLIGPQGAVKQVLGGATPMDAQQAAFREFINQGVTGFTDKGGRDWSLSAYTEMAVRTATSRAFNASNIAVIQATGNNLVTVSDDGSPCPRCFVWQGVVCCIVPDGIHPTIADAIAAGLMHPNCRHHWILVPAGTPPKDAPEWTPAHQAIYAASQRQRSYEREIRKAKTQLEYAKDPDQIAQAKATIARNRAHIKELVKAGAVMRQSRREQPDLSLSK